MITDIDRKHLQRCVELAEKALDLGNEPFGSLLVNEAGEVIQEAYNMIAGGDATQHPEFILARWSTVNLTPEQRAKTTMYTSGEHCPMCSAAHGFVGLGRIVYAGSAKQRIEWLKEIDVPSGNVRGLSITEVLKDIEVDGPDHYFAEKLRELHQKSARR